jgi:hypothetical protein
MQPSSLRFDTKLQVRRAGYDIEQTLFTTAFSAINQLKVRDRHVELQDHP